MNIYFLRHGEALGGFDDDVRPLSERGRHDIAALAKFLKKSGVRFDAIYSSPLVRACETAEIMLDLCGAVAKTGVRTDPALLNEISQEDFDRWLAQLPKSRRLLLVGHAPVLAGRARRLLGITHPEALTLPTGGMVCVEGATPAQARLQFFISPALVSAAH